METRLPGEDYLVGVLAVLGVEFNYGIFKIYIILAKSNLGFGVCFYFYYFFQRVHPVILSTFFKVQLILKHPLII